MNMRLLLLAVIGWVAVFFGCAAVLAQSNQPIQHQFTPEQSIRVNEAQAKSTEWGLKVEEWQRYQDLINGPRGIYSPGLDPLTVLGIESRSDEERRYYAELQVQAEAARVQKELAYQQAYDAAWKRLYPTLTPVANLSDSASPTISGDSGDGRLAVFVKENCSLCDQQIRQLQAKGQSFDVYLVDSRQDDAAVRRWATRVGIDAARVRSGAITLNHDGGRWLLTGIGGDLPAVVRHVEGRWIRQ